MKWRRVKWGRAEQVVAQANGLDLPDPRLMGARPEDAFAALRREDPDRALCFAAYALPRVDAVRWALDCLLGDGRADRLTAQRKQLLEMIDAWSRGPSESLRYGIYEAAEEIGFDTADGALGGGVFFSGGSIAPEMVDPVHPNPALFGVFVDVSLSICALENGPFDKPARSARFLDRFEEFAVGGVV